jgi:hypothetical protein
MPKEVLTRWYILLRLMAVGIRCADHVTPLYLQKLALTSPTSGGRSVGIVRSRTKAMEFSLVYILLTSRVIHDTNRYGFQKVVFKEIKNDVQCASYVSMTHKCQKHLDFGLCALFPVTNFLTLKENLFLECISKV